MALMSASLSGKLSHYWDMQTTNKGNLNYGNSVLDRIGSAHLIDTAFDGNNDAYRPVSGLNGSGLEFVGTTSQANLVSPMQWYQTQGGTSFESLEWGPGSGSFTLSWWDYQESLTTGDKDTICMAGTYGAQASNELAFIARQTSAGELKLTLYHSAGSFFGIFSTASLGIPLSGWKHWSIVFDKSSPEVLVYLNGSGQSVSTNSNIANLNYPGRNNSASMGLNMFSYRDSSTYTDSVWSDATNYKMDSCMVFNEPLTSGEISGLYNGGSGVTLSTYSDTIDESNVYDDLQHYYSFDQASPIASGSTLTDLKGTADLTLEARTDSVADGSTDFKIDVSGASGNGTATSGNQDPDWHFRRNIWNGTTETADSAFTMMGSGEPFSVSYWFKGGALVADNDGLFGVTNKDKSNANKDGHPLYERTNEFGVDQMYSTINDADGTAIQAGSQALSTTEWNHILFSVDPQRGLLRKITNGSITLSHSSNNAEYLETIATRAYVGMQSDDDYELTLLSINNAVAGSAGGIQQDNNNIDEIAFFNTALDVRHAEAIYNNGSGFAYAPLTVASGSSSGFLGGYLVGAAIASGSTSGSVGGYVAAAPIASGSSSGFLGGYLETTSIASGSASGSLGGYIDSIVLAEGSSSGFLGGYMKSAVIASGSSSGSLGGYVFAEHVSSGSASGLVHGYVSAEAVIASGSASGSLGGYIVAVPLAEASGTITISRPPTVVYSWDTSKLDPSGYRHVESGAYMPAAKSDLIGGFNKQAESGVALNLATLTDLNPLSTVVGDTKALTVSLGAPSGQNFDNATAGDIVDGLRVYNIKMWMNDTSDVSASGINPTVYYRTDSAWTKDIALTSASSGVQAFPISEASGISLGSVESTLEDSEITSYVYLFVELPSGAYNQGVVGGLGGGYEIRVSYDFTGEGDLL